MLLLFLIVKVCQETSMRTAQIADGWVCRCSLGVKWVDVRSCLHSKDATGMMRCLVDRGSLDGITAKLSLVVLLRLVWIIIWINSCAKVVTTTVWERHAWLRISWLLVTGFQPIQTTTLEWTVFRRRIVLLTAVSSKPALCLLTVCMLMALWTLHFNERRITLKPSLMITFKSS